MSVAGADLGVLGSLAEALGLIDEDGAFAEDWLSSPTEHLASILAEDHQRDALVRFVDEVLGGSAASTSPADVTWLPVFEEDDPDITISVVIDERPADNVAIGLGFTIATTDPASATSVHVPLFRADKANRTGPAVSPLLLGTAEARITLTTEITVDAAEPVPGEAHLRAVGLELSVPTGAGAEPSFGLTLSGLQMPGAPTPRDLRIAADDPGELDDAALDLVLGLVRAQAAGLPPGPLPALAGLLGLRDGANVPPLPLEDLATEGVAALAAWLDGVLTGAASRAAWLGQLAALVGGAVSGDEVTVTVDGVSLRLGVTVATGPDGHTRITPRVGAVVAAGADVIVRASADLATISLAGGDAVALPRLALELVLGRRPDGGTRLVEEAGPPIVQIDGLRAGVALDAARKPTLVLAADRVTIGDHFHETLDLSTPGAIADTGEVLLGDIADELLDLLGPAGDAVSKLLGLEAPAGHPTVPTLDLGDFLQDPLGAVAAHWRTLVADHPAAVPDLLLLVRDLLGDASAAADAVQGDGTPAVPWRIALAGPVALTVAIDGERLTLGVAAGFTVATLGQGCTSIETGLACDLLGVDLAQRHVAFLPGASLHLALRAADRPQAVFRAGPIAFTARHVALAGRWSPTGGLGVELDAPDLAVDFGEGPLELPVPSIGADGQVVLDDEDWDALEALLGALAQRAGPVPWLADLADALGWTPRERPPAVAARLRLAELLDDPVTALTGWAADLAVRDTELLVRALELLARLTAGTRAGIAGAVSGSGTPADPWLVPVARGDGAQLAVWLEPDGPPAARELSPSALDEWRPGAPGLSSADLAAALRVEALSAPDVRDLLAGRDELEAGFEALVTRWRDTDGRVVPPDADPPGITVHRLPDLAAAQLPAWVDPAELLGRELTTVVRVAVAAPGALPWPDVPPERVVDLTAPGLAPTGFSPPAVAAGEWWVALADRPAARLAAGDPDGIAGQAGRLARVLDAFAAVPGGVVLVAEAAAGHAARAAAEATASVTDLVLLGTPLGPVSFTVLDTPPAADVLRLLGRLLPPDDDDEDGDDVDLALGRGLVDDLLDLLALDDPARELRPPAVAPGAPRAGLAVHAVFGVAADEAVRRGLTAVVAAGIATRDRARAEVTPELPAILRAALRVPFTTATPAVGDVTVAGHATLDVGGLDASGAGVAVLTDRALRVHLEVGRHRLWLVGGPDPGRAPGARPDQELRRVSADVVLPLGGAAPARATLTLHEASAFGLVRERWVVQPTTLPAPPDADAATPALPEVRVLLAGVARALHGAADAGPTAIAAAVADALRALGLLTADGASVPDAVDHLLHDPAAHVGAILDAEAARRALTAALDALTPGQTGATPDELRLAAGPLTLTADLAARSATVAGASAPGAYGLVPWSGSFTLTAAGAVSGTLSVGSAGAGAAGGAELGVRSGPPLAVDVLIHAPGGAPPFAVALWPEPDAAALARTAARLVPAELTRLALEEVRGLDETARPIADAALDAVGLLGGPDADGRRRVLLPVALLADPIAWLRDEAALGGADGFDATKLVALLDALKPLLGVAGGPGEWRIVDGVTIRAEAVAGAIPRLALELDTSAFDPVPGAGRLAAGGSFGLSLPAGLPPRPAVDVFVGLTGPGAGRQAVHARFDGAITVLLRPAAGADIELYPSAAGLGSLAETAVRQALPFVLDRLAALTGPPAVAGQVGELVTALGDALGLRAGGHFTPAALDVWAQDPLGALEARLPALTLAVLDAIADAIDPILPAGAGADVTGGALRVQVDPATVTVTPSPLAVSLAAELTGVPAIERAEVGVGVDVTGLTAFDVEVGPAAIDAGVTLRPFFAVHAGTAPPGGRRVELSLGLGDDRRVGARWRLGDRFDLVVVDAGGEHTEPAEVALALLEAVLDLVAAFVFSTDAVEAALAKNVGSSTVRELLEGVALREGTPAADPLELDDDLFDPDRLLGRLQRLALNLGEAEPSVTIDGAVTIGLVAEGAGEKTLGARVALARPLALLESDITLSVETDARWIRLPGGAAVPEGIVVDALKAGPGAGDFTFAPGVSVNGVGLRVGRTAGPLLELGGASLGSIALHAFGRASAAGRGGGAQLQLSDLAIGVGGARGGNPVAQGVMGDAGSGPNRLAPAFSPALAIQKHGTDPERISLRAGDGAGPWWLQIQRGFGPIYVEQVGLGVTERDDRLERIALLLDGRVSLFGLTGAVDDLQLSFVVASDASVFDPGRWAVDLGGLAISSDLGGIVLQGGLRKFGSGDTVQYVGMLTARFAAYGLSAFGGYGQGVANGERFSSFFCFGAVIGPIGGPPAFFLTGIGGGLGINRRLIVPDNLSRFGEYPFIQALDPGARPSSDPMQALEDIAGYFPMERGTFWFAAGISFNSFALVDGVAVVAIQIGDGLEISLLGLARLALPRPQAALVSIELGLVARFSTREGVFLVKAQLTENSWLLYPDVRLTGGFAFAIWFAGPLRGQFVVTMGGYHPSFHRAGYPDVPRLGLQWRLGSYITVKGESYFALTSEAVMAGGRLEVSAELGPAWAHIVFGADGIVYFDPFRYEVDVYASIKAGITIDFWIGEVTFSISIGARIHLEGPSFRGVATFEVGPVELSVPFGDEAQTAKALLAWADFVRKYLEEATNGVARVVTAIPGRGALPPATGAGGATDTATADGSAARPFEVFAEFELTVTTLVPTRRIDLGARALSHTPSRAIGIAPMGVADAGSTLSLTLTGTTPDATARLQHELHHAPAFPVGIWGPPQPDDDRKVPEGDVIDAIDGVRLFTVADIPAGLPPIEARQVETGPRHPLPFVSESAARAVFVAEARGLRDLLPAAATDAEVYVAAAAWMRGSGQGATAVAALRRDRQAPPRFGALTEGLADAALGDPAIALPATPETPVVDTAVHSPVAVAVITAPPALAERPAVLTTVARPGRAVVMPPPTLDTVRASVDTALPAQLLRVGGVSAPVAGDTVVAAGAAPLTRAARGGVAALGGRGAVGDARERLAGLSTALSGRRAAGEADAVITAREIAVLRLPNAARDLDEHAARPRLAVTGGPARIVALAHGGEVLADDEVADEVAVPRGTERLAVAVAGEAFADPAGLLGWHAGAELAYVGWATALAAGATVQAEGGTVRRSRHRRTAGWVRAADLVAGTQAVTTRFAAAVTAVVVALDDPVGAELPRGLSLGLGGADRPLGEDGEPEPPLAVVRGNRAFLVHTVRPTGKEPVEVGVASQDGWHLAGVLGAALPSGQVAELLARRGVEAAVRPVLPGVGGRRTLAWRTARDPREGSS